MPVPRRSLYRAIVDSEPESRSVERLPLFEGQEKGEQLFEYYSPPHKKSWIKSGRLSLIFKLTLLSFTLALALTYGQCIINCAISGYNTLQQSHDTFQQSPIEPQESPHIQICGKDGADYRPKQKWPYYPFNGVLVPDSSRSKWDLECSGTKQDQFPCKNVLGDIENKEESYWRTGDNDPQPQGGHSIKINLKEKLWVHSIAMKPPPLNDRGELLGAPSRHEIYVSETGQDADWHLVAYGTWNPNSDANEG